MDNNAKRVVVIGGGTAGLSTALSLADLGTEVTVVERTPELGGHAAKWACMATAECAKCNACMIRDLVKRSHHHENINVVTSGEVQAIDGNVGAFSVTIGPAANASNGDAPKKHKIDADAVVVATGFEPYDATADPMLGYGQFPGVLTTLDLDEHLYRDEIGAVLPAEIEKPRVAFIQCVGSRDVKRRREYCSQFCCKTSVRLARRLKYLVPQTEITIFYIDLQIMGKEFRRFYDEARASISFVQGVPAEVTPLSPDGPYRVYVFDPDAKATQAREFDRIVLAIGVDHAQDNAALADMLSLDTDSMGFFLGFASQSPRPGIYLAGACKGPMDMRGAITRGQAAAARVRRDLEKKQAVSDTTNGSAGITARLR